MLDSRVRASARGTDEALPQPADEAALTAWLQALPSNDASRSGRAILEILQACRCGPDRGACDFPLLEKLHARLLEFSQPLEATFIDSSFPFGEEQLGNVNLLLSCLRELAENYLQQLDYYMHRQLKLKQEQQALFLYRALQAMGQILLYSSEAYLSPAAGFWVTCYRILHLSEQMQLARIPIADEEDNRQSINKLYRKILLFSLCNSSQFRPREMQKIYLSLDRFIDGVEVSSDHSPESMKGLYVFNLRQDSPPSRCSDNSSDVHTNEVHSLRYFNVLPAARNMHQALQQQEFGTGYLKSINRALFSRVIKTLSQVKSRKFTRLRENRNINGIIGFDNVLNYLRNSQGFALEDSNDHAVKTYDPRISGQWGTLDVDLVPMDNEVLYQQPKMKIHGGRSGIAGKTRQIFDATPAFVPGQNTGIWDQSENSGADPGNAVFFDDFAVQDSCIMGYSVVCDASNVKVRIGDIIGFLSADVDRVEIGLIRRIGTGCKEGQVQLGVELIAMEARLVYLTGSVGNKGLWAMLLPGMKALHTKDCVVFNTCEYRPGDNITLQREDGKIKCRLGKLINATASVNQITLLYESGSE